MITKRKIIFCVICIVLSAVMLISSVAFADSSVSDQLIPDYDAVKKIVIDGIGTEPSDDMKPLVVNGKAYVPLQFIEGAFGKKADFDPATGTITIGNQPSTNNTPVSPNKNVPGNNVLNIWSFTDEVPKIIGKYKELNPSLDFDFRSTIVPTMEGSYQQALDAALASGGANAPDIYCAESGFVLKYTKGDAAKYAASYTALGIDAAKLLKEVDIARYTVDIGTRPSDNKVVALSYQSTGGACIYRRSIAKAVWGTDDPKIIKIKIGPGWNQFFKAAAQLKAKGYSIVSSDGDIWHAIEGGSPTGWVVNGKLNIDPAREKFLDYAKQLKVNGWSNSTQDWTDDWFADMKGAGKQEVFSYFGPAWLINYVMAQNSVSGNGIAGASTYGDWAICEPPASFFWGGTWVLGNKDTKNKNTVGSILKWITLDSSDKGLQYLWANGTFNGPGGIKDTVPSAAVMKKSNGKLDFLNGQDMFEVFVPSNMLVSGKNRTQYDDMINMYWRIAAYQYANGRTTRSKAIAQFRKSVADNLGIR